MNRSEFLKILGLGSTGLIIPNTTWSQKPVKIYDNYVKGLSHYHFAAVRGQLVLGQELFLKRELGNLYDHFAVEVYHNDLKLGYLAAYENIAIANMLEQGVAFSAFISKIDPKEDVFDALAIEIYTQIVIENQPLIQTDGLTQRADDMLDQYRAGFKL